MKKKAEAKNTEPAVPEVEKRVTLAREAHAEMEERKSVFIGHAKPVKNEEEARAFIDEIRHRYADATHNVYAYLLNGGAVARYSDDGEPHGTSGVPTLNVLKMSGAMDLVVVVTRYFGGILLGAGGLVRAYSAAAKLAIDEAGLAVFEPWNIVGFTCSYSDYQKITAGLPKTGAVEEDADFGEDVMVTAAVKVENTGLLVTYISETTGGRSVPEILDTEERAAPLQD
ncbi:MAG: YigZ family protein [Clostridia bacterium]|nr:YigZ family protein [Clostridia bacterium]